MMENSSGRLAAQHQSSQLWADTFNPIIIIPDAVSIPVLRSVSSWTPVTHTHTTFERRPPSKSDGLVRELIIDFKNSAPYLEIKRRIRWRLGRMLSFWSWDRRAGSPRRGIEEVFQMIGLIYLPLNPGPGLGFKVQ